MQINFRDLVTQREAAKEEAEHKETADGAGNGPEQPAESDFRYPVQNRFTGLIERIQNNPDFLEGYDLSDSFIAADSEEEEESEHETVWGGFFINQGPILKKPKSDASPVKEKEREKK